jgi:serine/threonine protein kinase
MSTNYWTTVTQSPFPWELEALEFVRQRFPQRDPYRAWTNFEFIADDGSINEVDLLVLTPVGIFLVEIKSRPGILRGDAGTWTWEHEGRQFTDDNPAIAADRKAKKLRSLLERQKSIKKLRGRLPFIEPLVFCSAEQIQCNLTGNARYKVCLRDRDAAEGKGVGPHLCEAPFGPFRQMGSDPFSADDPFSGDKPQRPGIMAALMRRQCPGLDPNPKGRVDRPIARAVSQAMKDAGIRPSQKSRKVSDFVLNHLLMEGPGFQDWQATHVKLEEVKRRIRIYLVRQGATEEDRKMIERAALREFQLLETLQHPGILRTHGFTEHELGPALILEHFPKSMRLDHFLAQRGNRLDPDVRLDILRQITDVVRFAHDKRVVHRALSPQSILVVLGKGVGPHLPERPEGCSAQMGSDPFSMDGPHLPQRPDGCAAPMGSDPFSIDNQRPKIKVFNWQVGYRSAGTSGGPVTATSHVDRLVEDLSMAYMAPEAFLEDQAAGKHLDIFSLGAIAYHLFSGQPPAANGLELAQKVRDTDGLQISSVVNGAGENLQDLIQVATCPDVGDRIESARDFLKELDQVQRELLAVDHDVVEDPMKAEIGDKLPGGLVVKAELGTGSSSKVLLVEVDGQEAVLKIASEPEHNQRLRDEGEVLQKLRHQHIVEHLGTLELGDRVCLLIGRAGTETLGDRLGRGRLHAGLLQRFGEDLLQVVAFLEEQGISHRDIKPHNIGVGKVGRGDKLHLVLFDFSLSRTPPEFIRAGTVGYLDPFLADRDPPRWDLHAERYAAAVTLYESATKRLPKWGQGSNPAVVDYEATIAPESFDSSVREQLTKFFTKALRRNAKERFDNADEMLKAWRRCFEGIEKRPTTDHAAWEEIQQRLAEANWDTPVSELALSSSALDALDRKNVLTVRDLLVIKPGRLKRMSGIVGEVRRQIMEVADALRTRLGVPTTAQLTTLAGPDTELVDQREGGCSVDTLAARVARGNLQTRGDTERHFLQAFLGLDPDLDLAWPSQTDLAPYLGVTRGRISQLATAAYARWRRDPLVTRLRNDVAELVERDGGVMSAEELAAAVLLTRGSVEDEPLRSRQALAVTRAAVETERIMAAPRLVIRRDRDRVVISVDQDLADYAVRLGREADDLASQDPLVPSVRTLERLRAVRSPAGMEPLSDARLLRIAAAASQNAAVSSRKEFYPRGMDAERALKLSDGVLLGVRQLSVDEIRNRVIGRYPESAPLPGRPELDDLLKRAGFDFAWDQSVAPRGVYRVPTRDPLVSSHASTPLKRKSTELGEPTRELTTDEAEARQFAERLGRAIADGTFIAMTVEPRGYCRAIEELGTKFDVQVVDLESTFLRALREIADSKRVKWERVLQADAKPGGGDWERLMTLVRQTMPHVERTVMSATKTVLMVYPGLLARYEQLDVLTRIREKVGRADGIPGLWMLIATDGQSPLPVMDGKPIPVIGPAEWARIPDRWLTNEY